MRVLVTGCEGSLMQRVIPCLIEQKHQIRGVDSFVRYGEIERKRDYEFIRGDLTNAPFCKEVVQAAGLIYGIGGFHKYPADILSRDVTLHQNILWAMQHEDVGQIAYISSSMVYERALSHPSKEEDTDEILVPATDYGLSKLVNERLTRAFGKQYGIKFNIWRPFNIITPYEQAETEQGISHVFSDLIKSIVIDQAQTISLIGDGEQVRCFTWIDDVAEAIAQHSFTKQAEDDIFNLGNPQPTSVKELAYLIHRTARQFGVIDKPAKQLRFESRGFYADDVRIRIPLVAKAEKLLGWKPSVSVEESVRRCLEVYREALGPVL